MTRENTTKKLELQSFSPWEMAFSPALGSRASVSDVMSILSFGPSDVCTGRLKNLRAATQAPQKDLFRCHPMTFDDVVGVFCAAGTWSAAASSHLLVFRDNGNPNAIDPRTLSRICGQPFGQTCYALRLLMSDDAVMLKRRNGNAYFFCDKSFFVFHQ